MEKYQISENLFYKPGTSQKSPETYRSSMLPYCAAISEKNTKYRVIRLADYQRLVITPLLR